MESRRLITAVIVSLFILMAWEHIRMQLWPESVRPLSPAATAPANKTEQTTQTSTASAKQAYTSFGGNEIIQNPKQTENITIGNIDPASGFFLFAKLTTEGGTVKTLQLSQFSESVKDKSKKYTMLSPVKCPTGTKYSLNTKKIVIIGKNNKPIEVNLENANWFYKVNKTDNAQEIQFYLDIANKGKKVLRLTKTYIIEKKSYDMRVKFEFKNLSGNECTVELYQFGPIGIRKEDPRTDYRKIYAGLRLASSGDIRINKVVRKKILGKADLLYRLDDIDEEILWAGQANKYFAALLCPVDSKGNANGKKIKAVYAHTFTKDANLGEDLTTYWESRKIKIKPAAESVLLFELYLGPKSSTIFNKNPKYQKRYYAGTIEYTWCTMQWLADIMVKLIKLLFVVTRNYGLAIILLVVIVRLVLHPITKSSQMNMMRMQRNMQKLQPKMQAIKEKYKNNREAMNKAVMELYKEEGINPAGQMLGCLPMMLQMPIWVALWTSLNTTFELRHQPFILWIRDLAGPDSLIHLSQAINIPLISGMVGPIHDINILPLLLVISMLLQQKFMAQPTAPDADPAQAKQQKVMFYFMGIFFGLILYNAPSGLNLYILTSNFLGVIENKRIRKHLDEEFSKPQPAKKPRKQDSWWSKLQKKMEQIAKEYEQQKKK